MDNDLLNALNQDYTVNGIEEITVEEPAIIKVIGVGGGGSNAVNYMYERKIKDVEFAVCNTDRQALLKSTVPTKIQLGAKLTKGLGAGMEISQGREAALETIEEIKALLGGATQMVFITAGMGGGTGTGAAPVIAQIAKEMKLLTVAVVTSPYSWEGKLKIKHANEGIEELRKCSDTVLVVLNDKLEELYKNMKITEAFAQADSILLNAVKSISEIITTSGTINTDFKDVERVLKNAGQSVMGTASVSGENRAYEAVRQALDSPLLNDRDIKGAERILVTLASSEAHEAEMWEQREIWKYVLSQVGGEAHLFKLGTITDNTLGESLRVTVVAAGFDGVALSPAKSEPEPEIVEELPELEPVDELNEEAFAHASEMSADVEVGTLTSSDTLVMVAPQDEAGDYYDDDEYPYASNNVTSLGASGQRKSGDWDDAEYDRIREMVEGFRNKARVDWDELERSPAYRRSGLELWKRPDIPATEMEQIRLN